MKHVCLLSSPQLVLLCLSCDCCHRDKYGRVTKPAPFQSSVKSGEVARIQPNKKWFGKLVCSLRKLSLLDGPVQIAQLPLL